jgi:hypothetical protein
VIHLLYSFVLLASADDNAAFFKLHQATGFFEQFVAGGCSSGKTKAQSLLIALGKQKLDPDLHDQIRKLKRLVDSKVVPTVGDLEKFRLSIHQIMERKRFNHEQSWHDEVLAGCKGSLR